MDCKNLIHPFQNDPGVSQSQRILSDLLSGPAKIDGRTMADLLDYFIKLSKHINFYEADESIKDWSSFFEKSLPFIVTSIIKFDKKNIENKISIYNNQFEKKPSKAGLRFMIGYFNNNIIKQLNSWQNKLKKDIDLPVNLVLDKLIKDKLSGQLKEFITLSNTAVKWYGIKSINFKPFLVNEIWDLDASDIYSIVDQSVFKSWGNTKRKRLIVLNDKITQLVPTFLDVISVVSSTAEQSLEKSMFPLEEELTEQHPPHLAIIFSFLKLFRYLQNDLNTYTKKHLDFFYKEVLKLRSNDSVPDKAHIVFEIQKQLDKYLLKKGLLLKDGKDNNKAEILFSTDDEIVVNKTQVADKRTLFLNNRTISDTTYVEGVYMAPDAAKADGIDKDFNADIQTSWPTLGANLSKYTDPENKFIKPYPNARIGFILASPVLLLNEGKRTVEITLSCELSEDYCKTIAPVISNTDPCCEGDIILRSGIIEKGGFSEFYNAENLYTKVRTVLGQIWYYINRDLIAQAVQIGISKELLEKLNGFLVKAPPQRLCYCPVEEKLYERILTVAEFNLSSEEHEILKDIFKPRKALNVMFSGEKEWITPDDPAIINFSPALLPGNKFTITIKVVLKPDQKAVTFYNAEYLKEDFNTTLPVVKVELDDKIKLRETISSFETADECCERTITNFRQPVSLYHFFRNVIVSDDNKTKINVQVCGFKNFVVQNDDGLQNVNSPVYPFGTRPAIIDFNIVNPAPLVNPNLIGPNFYIGSQEIFFKNWISARININWKNKPTDFREYYKAYIVEDAVQQIFGLDEKNFDIRISALNQGTWIEEAVNRNLFDTIPSPAIPPITTNTACPPPLDDTSQGMQGILIRSIDFPGLNKGVELNKDFKLDKFNVDIKNGFIKINLRNQDFLHKDYAYVLARQMMALGRLPDVALEGAVYIEHSTNNVIVFKGSIMLLTQILNDIVAIEGLSDQVFNEVKAITTSMLNAIDPTGPMGTTVSNAELNDMISKINTIIASNSVGTLESDIDGLLTKIQTLQSIFSFFDINGKVLKPLEVPIPNEPWTPIIKEMSIDYTATASITDIELIHLYPYIGTYKNEELESKPTLFPTFCDEGNLFMGLTGLVPGSSLNILFQLAEATADSETEREFVKWYYLENNIWKLLRNGFEVIDDATDSLTTSGIIKFALPANMTNENTILPKGLHWIKAAITEKSRSVCETIGIYTQAVRATFTNEAANYKLRLSEALPGGSLSKLYEADALVKKTLQPYNSFGGRLPEDEGHFYVRVSELLRHKGRAIQKFDYERLALEAFPQLFKVKCINHSFALNSQKYYNDFPVAPGYVLLAVIPDLNQLKASEQFEPRVPVGLLEDLKEYLQQHTSPFVRLWVKNPRYEKVNFCLKVKLYPGRDENYYKERLKQDLREFLAPWAVGEYDKLTFGQCIVRSDIVHFIESRDYVDHIIDLKMNHEDDISGLADKPKVCPGTPRSILIAGLIDVCIKQQECESWCTDREKDHNLCLNEPELVSDYCKEEREIG